MSDRPEDHSRYESWLNPTVTLVLTQVVQELEYRMKPNSRQELAENHEPVPESKPGTPSALSRFSMSSPSLLSQAF